MEAICAFSMYGALATIQIAGEGVKRLFYAKMGEKDHSNTNSPFKCSSTINNSNPS